MRIELEVGSRYILRMAEVEIEDVRRGFGVWSRHRGLVIKSLR